jgi:uncharacterized protein YkwD
MAQTPCYSTSRKIVAAFVLCLLVAATNVGLAPTSASANSTSDENALFAATNQSRADNSLSALQYDPQASAVANAWANQLASSQTLSHNPNLAAQLGAVAPDWTRIGENVGFGPSVPTLENAFMNSAPHRSNILGQYNRVGIGATRDGNGTLWVVVDFIQASPIATTPPPGTPVPAAWLLRSTPAAGTPDNGFNYGVVGYNFVSGDWNGDGTTNPGVYFNGNWYLRNSASSGSADVSFSYGAPGYFPVVGDWDGNGTDTIGVYYQGWWYLRNSNTPGPPDIIIHYGNGFYWPVVGDWNGNGKDTIGCFVNGMWYLRNSNTDGAPDISVNFGAGGYVPVTGAWTGGSSDGIGVYVGGMWYLRNTPSAGSPNKVVAYGAPGYTPIVGQWTKNGPTGIGVIVPN